MERVAKLRAWMAREGVDLFLIEDPLSIFYLTGLTLSAGKFLVGQEEASLIVDGRYWQKAKEQKNFSVMLWSAHKPFEYLHGSLVKAAKRLGFDSVATTHASFLTLQEVVGVHAPRLELVAYPDPLRSMRVIKDPEEIERMRRAARLGSEGYDFVASFLREGVTEKEVACQLEIFWKNRGADKVAFESIIAFGKNASLPHHRPGQRALTSGDIVLIDIGVCLDHYHSDMTRTLFFRTLDPKWEAIYHAVLEAQEAAIAACRSGVKAGELDEIARGLLDRKGYGEAFCHALGHGIGLDVHEFPRLRAGEQTILQAGMLITIEPGVYIPHEGGVRIEDTLLVTECGAENLTDRSKAVRLL